MNRKNFFDSLGEYWCQMVHKKTTWPMHGRYVCQECFRVYPVTWEAPMWPPEPYTQNSNEQSHVPLAREIPLSRTLSALE